MNNFTRITLVGTGMVLLTLLPGTAAMAHDNARVNWSVSVGVPYHPVPVYVQPPPVYYAPQPVYYAPQPVYVQPAPIYLRTRPVIAPYPVIYAPYPRQDYRHHGWRHRHGHDHTYRD